MDIPNSLMPLTSPYFLKCSGPSSTPFLGWKESNKILHNGAAKLNSPWPFGYLKSVHVFENNYFISNWPWIGLDYVYSWGERISLWAVSNWKQLHVPSCSISTGKREVVVGACTTGIIWRACSGLHHMLNLKIHKVHLWCLLCIPSVIFSPNSCGHILLFRLM